MKAAEVIFTKGSLIFSCIFSGEIIFVENFTKISSILCCAAMVLGPYDNFKCVSCYVQKDS